MKQVVLDESHLKCVCSGRAVIRHRFGGKSMAQQYNLTNVPYKLQVATQYASEYHLGPVIKDFKFNVVDTGCANVCFIGVLIFMPMSFLALFLSKFSLFWLFVVLILCGTLSQFVGLLFVRSARKNYEAGYYICTEGLLS